MRRLRLLAMMCLAFLGLAGRPTLAADDTAGNAKHDGTHIHQAVQFSTTNPGTSRKSVSLSVTTISPWDSAWAAINRS